MISGMARTSLAVELSAEDQTRLQQWQSAHGTPQQVALRCRWVLAAAAGASPGSRDRRGLGDSSRSGS